MIGTRPARAGTGRGSPPRPSAAGLRIVTVAAFAGVVLTLWGTGAAGERWVFVVGVAAGIPHGAVDHVLLIGERRSGHPGRSGSRPLAVAAVYGLGVLAGVAAFLIDGAMALAVTAAVSIYHFGWGEGSHGGPGRRLALGVLPVLGPLAAQPAASRRVLEVVTPSAASAWSGGLVLAGRGALVVIVAVGLCEAARAGDRIAVAELLVLATAATLLPPLAVFGCYFALWHSARHAGRLLHLGAAPSCTARVMALVRQGAAPTVVAYVALVAAWLFVPRPHLVAVGLIGLLAVSIPHTIAIARLPPRGAPRPAPAVPG